ncbi:MAG: pentapeptide repeat-containing protein [Gammaproteobacteria bacterium]|nr:pentapeptide repeat-containing protein [Gammaproteobacteria bacterium]
MEKVNAPSSHPKATRHTSPEIEDLVSGGTDLRNIDFSKAQQLLSSQLAGKDLSGAILPPHIQLNESLSQVESLSKNTRNVFLSTILACIYSWLTLATTSDMALISNSASSTLPIINTAIPIVGFYWVAPLLLLGLYFYLHLYLQRLWDVLAELPAVFPDGNSLDKKIYPWLLSGLVNSHFSTLKQQRPRFSRLQVGLSILLSWWLVPITFFIFWISYIPRHDGYGTALHTALLVVAIYVGIRFYVSARDTLCRQQQPVLIWKMAYKNRRCYQQGGIVLGISLLLGGISFSVTQAVPGDMREKMGLSSINSRVWLPGAMQWLGVKIFPELTEAQFSTKPDEWDEADRGSENAKLIMRVKGAQLKGVQLAYANVFSAFLVNADLRGANLAWADLRQADLRGARLDGANLQGANLSGAKMAGASLRNADLNLVNVDGKDPLNFGWAWVEDLRGVNFVNANINNIDFWSIKLTGASFQEANLDNVAFSNTNLTGVNFQGANFNRVNFFKANLHGTNFKKVKGLAPEIFLNSNDLSVPVNWIFAVFSDEILTKLGLPHDHNVAMREKNLRAYNLRNASFKNVDFKQFYFSKANMEGAEFYQADMNRADFQGTNLKNVKLEDVNFQGADLQGANLEKTDIRRVNFTGTDLRNVNFERSRFYEIKIIETNLEGANMKGVSLASSDIKNYIESDLRGVAGLTCNFILSSKIEIAETSQLPDLLKTCGNKESTRE